VGDVMAKKPKAVLAAAATLAVLLIGGCARGIHEQTPEGTTVNAVWAGPLTHPINFSFMGYALTPPTAAQAAAAKITPDQAFVGCSSPTYICPKSQATIVLALATTANNGAYDVATNTSKPLIVNRLVYVLLWATDPCMPVGPAQVQGQPTQPPSKVQNCMALDLIDANTSADLGLADTNDPASISIANSLK
jgi:hypothetical protein